MCVCVCVCVCDDMYVHVPELACWMLVLYCTVGVQSRVINLAIQTRCRKTQYGCAYNERATTS